jgi:hypothetical protein
MPWFYLFAHKIPKTVIHSTGFTPLNPKTPSSFGIALRAKLQTLVRYNAFAGRAMPIIKQLAKTHLSPKTANQRIDKLYCQSSHNQAGSRVNRLMVISPWLPTWSF